MQYFTMLSLSVRAEWDLAGEALDLTAKSERVREREPLVVKSLLCSDLEMCTASRVLVTVQWYCSVRSPLLYLQTPQLQFDSSLDLDVLLATLPILPFSRVQTSQSMSAICCWVVSSCYQDWAEFPFLESLMSTVALLIWMETRI